MSEEGCLTDLKRKNMECSKLLIKDGADDILYVNIYNNIELSKLLLPSSDASIDIGSSTLRFRHLYISDTPTLDNHAATKKYVDDNSGIVNNRIDGDLIIGEDNSESLIISSNTKFEGGISGNVGIGTSTPSALLHLSKLTTHAQSTPSELLRLSLADNSAHASNPDQSSGSGTKLTFVNQKNSSESGTHYIMGEISGEKDNHHDSVAAGRLVFRTNSSTSVDSNAGTVVERMRIDASGNVGIGISSPRKELHLKHTDDNTELIIESGSNNQSKITLCEDTSGNYGFDIQYDGGSTAGSNSNMFYIRSINNGSKTISLSSIRSSGYIGILDDNPSTALDVNGTVTCTGFNNTSDDRIKYNEVNINTSTALNVINQLTPQIYEKIIERPQNLNGTWIPTDTEWDTVKNETITQTNEDGSTTILPKWNYQNETGLVAQDVKNISELSYCVIGDEVDASGNQTPLKLNYTDIFSYHIAATKELTTQLNTANQKIATLESEIAAIKTHIGL